MQRNLVNFALLQFSRGFSDDEAVKILLVHSCDGEFLQGHISPHWEGQVNAADRAYLYELLEDWRSTPPDQIGALTNELCRQSQGPIKLLDYGRTSVAECRALIAKVT